MRGSLTVLLLLVGCAADGPHPPRAEAQAVPGERGPEATLPAARTEMPARPLPDAVPHGRGPWDVELNLPTAAFDTPGPSVLVHAPPGFDPTGPLELIVFLHGWNGCARVLAGRGAQACREGGRAASGWGLNEAFDTGIQRVSRRASPLFLVPQLAWRARDGSAGRFAEREAWARFVGDLLVALEPRLGPRAVDDVQRVTLLAHSAGFEAALAIAGRGGMRVDDIVLFDALYRGVDPFLGWAEGAAGRRLVSYFTGRGRTAAQNQRLTRLARARLGEAAVWSGEGVPDPAAIAGHRVLVARSSAPHADVPVRHLGDVIEGLARGAGEVCSEGP